MEDYGQEEDDMEEDAVGGQGGDGFDIESSDEDQEIYLYKYLLLPHLKPMSKQNLLIPMPYHCSKQRMLFLLLNLFLKTCFHYSCSLYCLSN